MGPVVTPPESSAIPMNSGEYQCGDVSDRQQYSQAEAEHDLTGCDDEECSDSRCDSVDHGILVKRGEQGCDLCGKYGDIRFRDSDQEGDDEDQSDHEQSRLAF